MAWSGPRTWLASEQLSAALLNVEIGDNLRALRAPDRLDLALTADQSIPNASYTPISWPAPASIPTGFWAREQPTRLVGPTAGLYALHGVVEFGSASTVGVRAVIWRPKAWNLRWLHAADAANAGSTRAACSDVVPLAAADDWIEVLAYQTSGADLELLSTSNGAAEDKTRATWSFIGEA